jgi:hypothetical protein
VPVVVSQSFVVLSQDAEANKPLLSKATAFMALV